MPGAFPQRGEIWLVDFPDDPKLRPALIVSPASRNEFANSVLAIPITTHLRPAPTHVPLTVGQGGLSQGSMARCENVSYIYKSRLQCGRFAGAISSSIMIEIERSLLRALGIAT